MAQAPQQRNQLAEGIWLLSAGAIIQAVIVAKKLADKMLSKTAIAKADVINDELHYPEVDGRSSIPMLELSQKGYLELQSAQIKEHFNRLVQLVPDYLKERGMFPQKPIETIGNKIEKDYAHYTAHIKYMSKQQLISNAAEIADMQRIKDFIQKAELSTTNMGLLLKKDDLLTEIRNKALLDKPEEHPDLLLTRGRLSEAIHDISEELAKDTELVKSALSPFENELAVAKKPPFQSVTFTIKNADMPPRQITMSINDFYKHMDTATLNRFAETHMQDFPSPDYYGEQGAELYEKIRCKRFCEDIKENFYNFSKDLAPGYLLHIDKLNKNQVTVNNYDALQDRIALKKYIEVNYDEPQTAVDNIKSFVKEQSVLINEVQSMLQEPITSMGQIVPQEHVPHFEQQTEEHTIPNDKQLNESTKEYTEEEKAAHIHGVEMARDYNNPVSEEDIKLYNEFIAETQMSEHQATPTSSPNSANYGDYSIDEFKEAIEFENSQGGWSEEPPEPPQPQYEEVESFEELGG